MDFKAGLEFLRFLDVNSGYHQIPMYLEDEEELFATGQCYLAWKIRELLTSRWSIKCSNTKLEGT